MVSNRKYVKIVESPMYLNNGSSKPIGTAITKYYVEGRFHNEFELNTKACKSTKNSI